jgi:hypothetical protein
MERIETLIQKLQHQLSNNASNAQLLSTAELLVVELRTPVNTSVQKVSVQMPYVFVSVAEKVEAVENIEVVESKVKVEYLEKFSEIKPVEVVEAVETLASPIVAVEDIDANINLEKQPLQNKEETIVDAPKTTLLQKPTQILANALEEFFPSKGKINFNEMLETLPTFSSQATASKQVFELNDVMLENEESLNDVFKTPVVEVAQAIKEAPVKDLRKAIGVNDKYLFINELFKGDEAMYDKCIKTINSFSVYPEAETWIRRELLVKMGWDEKGIATKQFYNIVMRRFS